MLLRPASVADVPALVEMQEVGAVAGLSHLFPQDRYPFPREAIAADWVAEIGRPDVDVFVATRAGGPAAGSGPGVGPEEERIVAFAALQGDELLHFGTAVDTWGSGLAARLNDELVAKLADAGHTSAWLRVFRENFRARRFYEKMGWRATSETSYGEYPPYPLLMHYVIDLPPSARPRP